MNLTTHLKALKVEKIRRKLLDDFYLFIRYGFSLSFKEFITGDFIKIIAQKLSHNPRTMEIGPRDHMKSTRFYAYFMWRLLRQHYGLERSRLECHYFSYKEKMATYHIGSPKNEDNIKDLIRRNPLFYDIQDTKEKAENTAIYTTSKGNVSLSAQGLLTFVRGVHTKGIVFVDDPLQDEDPTTKLDPTKVKTINNRIMSSIYSMPQYESGGELHIIGTPQTEEDFYFDPKFQSKFAFDARMSINKDNKPLFPEFRPLKWLLEKKDSLPEKIWLQEYMCRPTHSLDSYLIDEKIKQVIDTGLINYMDGNYKCPETSTMVAGFDVGKHQHPSHLSVMEITNNGKFIQRVTYWLDKWDYTKQIDLISDLSKKMGISQVFYDASRGEFETLQEMGELPECMVAVNLTGRKKRFDMARALSQKIESDTISLINDDRQYRQMLLVDSDLKARETSEGHGDSFWSNALCMMADAQLDAYLEII